MISTVSRNMQCLIATGLTIYFATRRFGPSAAFSAVPTYYCHQDKVTTITGQAKGIISTLSEGQEFYGNNVHCSWVIDAGENHLVKLSIVSLDLQWVPSYTTCSGYDNLQIKDGSTDSGHSITSICHDRDPQNIISKGRHLYVKFSTTHQNFGSLRGVQLKFETFANNTCPPEWFQVPGGDDTECWLVSHSGAATWSYSQEICSYSHANLASIITEQEYLTVIAQGKNKSISEAWVGLSDIGSEGTFQWIDTEELSIKRDISGNGEWRDCIAQDFDTGKWLVKQCDKDELHYVCKANKDGSTTIHQAVPVNTTPTDGTKSSRVYIPVLIAVVAVVAIFVLILAYFCCLRSKYPNLCKCQKSKPRKTRYVPSRQDSDTVAQAPEANSGPRRLQPVDPSAPPLEILFHDPQMVAPPTYEEAQYHPRLN